MIQYVITQEQYDALINQLKLEEFNTPDPFCLDETARKAQTDAVERMHRRFLYRVATAITGNK